MSRRVAIGLALLAALCGGCEPESRDFTNPFLTVNAQLDHDGDGVANGDDPDPLDPYCSDTLADDDNCGECGRRCSEALPHANASCDNGRCVATACEAGWSDVNGDLVQAASDGCECQTDDPLADVSHCGACGHACPSLGYHVEAPLCVDGGCEYACTSGFSDADGDLGEDSVNGCECQTDDPLTDADHCGELCLACPELAHATRACVAGACAYTCHATWEDANGDLAQPGSDGCEAWRPSCERTDLGSGEDAVAMCLVPAGEFTMGCANIPWGCAANEEPEHSVTLTADTYIDEVEVTRARFADFVAAEGDWSAATGGPAGSRCAAGYLASWSSDAPPAGTGQHPVVEVCWHAAAAYCAWAGKRLPGEAEWEYGARSGDARRYPWGDAAPDGSRANCAEGSCADGNADTAPVGQFSAGASKYGLLDLAGNAREWTADWFGMYSADAAEDPTGPTDGDDRVIRGGSFEDLDVDLRVTRRQWAAPEDVDATTGFRCAVR